ncbi:26S proteasome non-ATPase regulatory subunit 7-like B [Glycine soja]|uniref:26S proteasome non-ATPase regulatory subunit 7-like B n=1 Tax=Glycine soja TaxID=3848 RepID=A0A445EZY6_GLYSO|nr:26S proteasome non-ATPase regulatory subunit 7-like B [Glycine soja]
MGFSFWFTTKEHVVGWYSTGPKLRENDFDTHGLFNVYVPNPVLVIIDVEPKELGIPRKTYYVVEEVKEYSKKLTYSLFCVHNATQKSQKVFVHVPSEITTNEVEEILVEHLLRYVKDTTISILVTKVSANLTTLKGLDARLKEIRGFFDLVIDGKLPLNHEILYHLQDVFNLLPNLNVVDLLSRLWYRAPELLLGSTDYGFNIDLCSAGCLLAEMLVGRPIMPGRTGLEQIHMIFKLCGSSSEDYFKKLKLTSYQPPNHYKLSFEENF